MSRILLSFLVVLAIMGCETASMVEDPSTTHFIKFYGRDGDQTGRDLVALPDGSMVLFGTTQPTVPPNGTQWYVVKVDAKGTIIWEREYGGISDEEARDIEVTAAGNLVLVGNSYTEFSARDVLVLILSAVDGSMLDSALVHTDIAGTTNDAFADDDASGISESSDGFLISGTTTYTGPLNSDPGIPGLVDTHDALKIRLESDLDVWGTSWTQVYGLWSQDGSTKVIEAPPGKYGDYYAFGYSNAVLPGTIPNFNFWLVVLGPNGDPLNIGVFTGTSSDEIMSSFDPSVRGYFLGGMRQSTTSDVYFVEAIPDTLQVYNLPVEKNLSLSLGSNLSGHTALSRAAVNGGLFILTEENGFNNNQNWILTRVTNDGDPVSVPIVFGGEGFDSVGALRELPDGRVVIIGTMRTGRPDAGEYKMTLVKVNHEGKFEK